MIHDFSYSLMERFKCPKCLMSSTPPRVSYVEIANYGDPDPTHHLSVACRRCGYSERMREADQPKPPKPLIVNV